MGGQFESDQELSVYPLYSRHERVMFDSPSLQGMSGDTERDAYELPSFTCVPSIHRGAFSVLP